MVRYLCAVLLLMLLSVPLGCARAEEKKAAASPDPVKFAQFLRRYFSWPADISVIVGPFKPAPVTGLLETTVKISYQGQRQESTFLVSADGQYLIQGPAINMTADPFAETRKKIDLKGFPALGSPLAPVTIVEYGDLQCPFCKAIAGVLKDQLVPHFGGDVRLVFKDFPLTQIHPWAMQASLLGRCLVKRYGDESFWAYHDWVFANQQELNANNFKEKGFEFARTRSIDTAQLGTCMEQPDVKAEVNRSLEEAQSLGVTGTPTIFINGRRVVGNQPFQQLRQTVATELDYAKGQSK